MRFGQGLIQSLINPSYGQGLFTAGQGMGQIAAGIPQQARQAQEQRQGMFNQAIDYQQQYQQAAQSGDARLASQSANQLLDLARKSGDSDMAQTALKQLESVETVRESGALKGLVNIDRALANPTVSPEAKAALEQRKSELLTDGRVFEAYTLAQQEQSEAARQQAVGEANLTLKQAEVAELKRQQKVTSAVAALKSGATADSLKSALGSDIVMEAEDEVREWKVAQQEAKDALASSSVDYSSSAFKELLPEQQKAIKNIESVEGKDAAKKLFARTITSNAEAKVKASRERATQQENVDVQVAVNRYLSGGALEQERNLSVPVLSRIKWAKDRPVPSMYKDADEEVKEAIRLRAESLMVQALQEANTAGMSPQEASQAAIEAVDRALTREFAQEERQEASNKVEQEVVEVASDKEVEQLPSGTRFKGPDGIERIKP